MLATRLRKFPVVTKFSAGSPTRALPRLDLPLFKYICSETKNSSGDDATQTFANACIPKGVISIRSHGLRACTQNRFRHPPVSLFFFYRKIASPDGHFTDGFLGWVRSNTNGMDTWMTVYIRGCVSWMDSALPEKGYADLLLLASWSWRIDLLLYVASDSGFLCSA